MEIVFSKKAQNDILLWNKSGKKKILKKISELLRDIQRTPYEGIRKPEQLKHNLSGVWSRRIDKEHRLVYEIIDEKTIEILNILSVKGHYE